MSDKLDLDMVRRSAEPGAVFGSIIVRELVSRLEQAEQAVERKQDALNTIVEIFERALDDVIAVTDSRDVIGENGDGDWDIVWERLAELADKKREAEQQVARVRELHTKLPDPVLGVICAVCVDGHERPEEYPCPTIKALDGEQDG